MRVVTLNEWFVIVVNSRVKINPFEIRRVRTAELLILSTTRFV